MFGTIDVTWFEPPDSCNFLAPSSRLRWPTDGKSPNSVASRNSHVCQTLCIVWQHIFLHRASCMAFGSACHLLIKCILPTLWKSGGHWTHLLRWDGSGDALLGPTDELSTFLDLHLQWAFPCCFSDLAECPLLSKKQSHAPVFDALFFKLGTTDLSTCHVSPW